jgi:23S rRNA (uracil1939-C5)-methyltransferase
MTRQRREPETARIESVTHDGRGIALLPGKKVFVAGALPGETVRFRRRKRRRNFDEAELLEVLEPSSDRIEPHCAVYGTCGGCSLQHTSDKQQRSIKLQALADNLQRIGQVEPERWLEPIYDDTRDGSWHYRRRARLAVKDVAGKGRVLVGFRERHAPYLTDMHRCEVLAKPVDGLLDPLSEMIGTLSIRKRLPQIEVAIADNATALLFRVLDPPTDEDREILTGFAIEHGVRVLLQTGGLDSVTPLHPQPPLDPLSYELSEFDVTINFEASDFVQINSRVNQRMVSEAIRLLQIGADDRVLDLYCGIGNFSLPMARTAQHVLGVEGEMHQVQRATDNARRNGIDNCEFRCADLGSVEGSESWLNAGWDRVLLDPARSGAAELVGQMGKIAAARIVYVSCHPGTLARDAATLVQSAGYRLEAAGIIDMFPHTGHVESLAVFQKGARL